MAAPGTLQRGDQVPHFEVRTLQGDVFSYEAIWQRKNLVLVTLPAAGRDDAYASELAARLGDFEAREGTCVITRDPVAGVEPRTAIVADRWGEIVHVARASPVEALPTASELLGWLEYIEQRCPECEGEAK